MLREALVVGPLGVYGREVSLALTYFRNECDREPTRSAVQP